MKTKTLTFTFFALFAALVAMAQDTPPAANLPVEKTPPLAPLPEPTNAPAAAMEAGTTEPPSAQIPATTPAPTAGNESATPPSAKNEIRLNFQGASLGDVLNYLSEAAGFVIVQEAQVSGTVNIISKQPLTADEAVDLLNTVLMEKGYVAIRNGRILKIVSKTDAPKRDLPVITGSDPEKIPRKDAMVTQILPIRYAEAGKLIENLRPLLSADATISSNENSNALILTDTQANIHRIAEIIRALDTSISGISTIHVFPLRFADAKDFAAMLTQLFNTDQNAPRNGQNNNGAPGFFGRNGGGNGGRSGRNGGGDAQPQSEARVAAVRVIAVADEQSNSVIVSAPDEYMPTISEIVSRLDTSGTEVTETRLFRLEHADATELSDVLNSLYGDSSTSTNSNNRNGNQNNRNQQWRPPQNNQPQNNQPSERALQQARMVAVPDPRTNTIIVTCSKDMMTQVALTIGRLDASDSKKQHVYVHVLEHADPDNVAAILRTMFGDTTSQNTVDTLNQRTTTGASSAVTNTLNTNGNSGNGR